MKNEKWTPGPWQASTDMPGEWVVWRGVPAEAVLAEIYSDDMGFEHNAEANAQLIAASPKMADFIQRLIDDGMLELGWREEAEEIMAKARGE